MKNSVSLELLLKIRTESSVHLPIDHSFIPYDILLSVATASTNNRHHSVKSLFAELPYSEMGLRYHFRRLVAKDWIQIELSSEDSRIRLVKPTEKCLNQIDLMISRLNSSDSPQI